MIIHNMYIYIYIYMFNKTPGARREAGAQRCRGPLPAGPSGYSLQGGAVGGGVQWIGVISDRGNII